MFLRKFHLGWKKCAVGGDLSVRQVSCALYITTPTRPLGYPEAKEVFDIAEYLETGPHGYPDTALSFQ
jgi:hypothetical protein